jgi:hypothetical protein
VCVRPSAGQSVQRVAEISGLGDRKLAYPKAKWTTTQVSRLYRTLICAQSAVTPVPAPSDVIVNCGRASFRFGPSL